MTKTCMFHIHGEDENLENMQWDINSTEENHLFLDTKRREINHSSKSMKIIYDFDICILLKWENFILFRFLSIHNYKTFHDVMSHLTPASTHLTPDTQLTSPLPYLQAMHCMLQKCSAPSTALPLCSQLHCQQGMHILQKQGLVGRIVESIKFWQGFIGILLKRTEEK